MREHIPEIPQLQAELPLASIHAKDVTAAEKALIRTMQKSIDSATMLKYKELQLFHDENKILRCKGRLNNIYLQRDAREPILLLPGHHLTHLIIEQYHKQCGHQGTNATLANLRQKYWIPKGRQTVKKCLRKCLQCKI